MNHLRLLIHRQTMVSLSYDLATGRLCGDLAIDIVQSIGQHGHEASQPSSFRFHMATSLGGAILILATLLVHPLSPAGLEKNHSAYADKFRHSLAMLRQLALYLQAARRIVSDLEDIIQVVLLVLDQPSFSPQGSLISALPTNMDDLFPYTSLDFAQQAGMMGYNVGDEGGTFDYDGTNTLDSWGNETRPLANVYGVPWI